MESETMVAEETVNPAVESARKARAEEARARAAQLVSERKFDDAKKALEEAEELEIEIPAWKAEREAKAEEARVRAAQLLSERRFAEAKSALEEAEELDVDPPKWRTESRRVITLLRDKLPKHKEAEPVAEEPVAEQSLPEQSLPEGAVEKSLSIVSSHSKVAAAAGLLPGGALNFAGVLAVQITMIWKIAKEFGHTEGKDRVRGSVLSLLGSVIPAGLGHGAGAAVAAIPAVIAGTVVYFVAAPVLAYATTQAVGNAFIMHFESGGTLLTFDAKKFGDYFLHEYQKAGGTIVAEEPAAEAAAA